MRPVFEHAFVDALRLPQIGALVGGNPVPENMVVGALDNVDGVDLHITQMFHRGSRRLRPLAEWHWRVEPLGAQPDVLGFRLGQGVEFIGARHGAAM